MQCVAELVEDGDSIVPGDEHLARALHEIGIVGDDGRDRLLEPLLCTVFAHPGAGLLAGPREWIEIKETGRPAVLLEFEHPHIRRRDRHALDLGERKSVALPPGPEGRLYDAVQHEISLHRILIDGVFRLPDFLCVVAIIPWRD